jgi:NitT/TauT family transport system substrate-binding protein
MESCSKEAIILNPDKKKFFSFFRSILVMFLISGLLFSLESCKQGEKVAGTREKITIAYSIGLSTALVHIAFAKGYFADEGLDVTPQTHGDGKLALDAVLQGKADLATVGDTPFVFAVMKGKKIAVIATIATSNRNDAIVARLDRGIAKPADLNGKNIGVPLGTTADYFANSFLLFHGVKRKRVTFIDMKPDEMAGALDKGRVDAVSIWNTKLKQLEKGLGSNGTIFYGESIFTEAFCITAWQEFIKKNPETIKKVLRALIKAETFVEKHYEEARLLEAEFIKVDKAVLDGMQDIFTFRVALDQALLVDLEDQTRWILKNRLAARTDMPNYLDFIYFDSLLSVKPDAVKMIR